MPVRLKAIECLGNGQHFPIVKCVVSVQDDKGVQLFTADFTLMTDEVREIEAIVRRRFMTSVNDTL